MVFFNKLKIYMLFLLRYFKNYKWLLLLTLLLATTNQLFSLLDPQIFRWLIDEYVTKHAEYSQQDFLYWIVWGLAGLVWVAMVSRLAKTFQDYYVNVMTQKIGMSLYQDAIRHIFDLPYKTFENQQSGQLLQKLQKARQDIQNFIKTLIGTIFFGLIGLAFVITYAFTVHWVIGLLFLLLVPIMGVTFYLMSKKIREAQRLIVMESSLLAWATTESIRNVALIKSLGLVEQEMDRLENTNTNVLKLEIKKIKILRTILFVQGTLINFLRIVIMGIMFRFVYTQAISLGEFMSLFFYTFFVFGPLRQAGEIINNYQDAKASHELVEELMTFPSEPHPESPESFTTTNQKGRIESIAFDYVGFSYDELTADKQTPAYILDDISFEVKAWETIAFVGPSGAGKSTILKLLYKLYPPVEWKITINGISLSNLLLHEFKEKLGIVSQEAQLFAGTIKQNLLFANPQATEKDCLDVLKQASLEKLLQENAEWLETKIGEGWLKLSWGQRQRLAIARALLRNPDVLIFDEATSALDSLVEKEITDTIKQVTKKRDNLITILVAHRLSTIMHADHIFVLEKGKIVEHWTHENLIKTGKAGLYKAMWRQQAGESI